MGSLGRRLERLEANVSRTERADSEARIPPEVEDYLTELAIHRGELSEEDVPNLEESRRQASEAAAALQDEWRRLEERRWGA